MRVVKLSSQAPAIRDNQPTTVGLHQYAVPVSLPDGQVDLVALSILYDPDSGLCWWHFHRRHSTVPDPNTEILTRWFIRANAIWLTADRIILFSSHNISDSSWRFQKFEHAERYVLDIIQQANGKFQATERPSFRSLDRSGVPLFFFNEPWHSEMPMLRVTGVIRTNGMWRVTIAGPNGHSATLSLGDSYETIATELSPEVPPAQVERVIRSWTVDGHSNGRIVKLDARELLIRYPSMHPLSFNQSEAPIHFAIARVLLLYNPATLLSWWWRTSSDEDFLDALVEETEDRIVAFRVSGGTIYATQFIEARYVDWSRFESDVLGMIRVGSHGPRNPWRVGVSDVLPAEFCQPSFPGAPPQISRANGLWRIVLTGVNRGTAVVELNSDYQLLSARVLE